MPIRGTAFRLRCHLVPAAEHQRQVAGVQQRADLAAKARLRRLQVAILAADVANVISRRQAVPGQIGQCLAQRQWTARSPHPPMIAAHAFIASKTQQRQARLAALDQRLDTLMPAGAIRFGINAPPPGLHRMTINGHG
jgi:hypothetical protein